MNQFGMTLKQLYPTVYGKTELRKGKGILTREIRRVDVEATEAAVEAAHEQLRQLRKLVPWGKRSKKQADRPRGAPFARDHETLPPAKVEAAPRRVKDLSSRKRRRLAAAAFNALRVEL